MPIKPELISFETSDHLNLPGLLYEPESSAHKVVIFLHGNGSSSIFYKTKKMNLFAAELSSAGWAFLPFNNRGAHYLKKFTVQVNGEPHDILRGTAMETIEESVLDIEAVVAFAQSRGYSEIVLVGESSGANKIVLYNLQRPDNPCLGYALVGGGDDTGLFYLGFGEEKFRSILAEAQERVQTGHDEELLSADLHDQKFAYRALADIMDPDGLYNLFPFYEYFSGNRLGTKPLFQEFQQISKPTLILYGSEDKYCYRSAEEVVSALLTVHPSPQLLTGVTALGADHSFSGTEELEISEILKWLPKIAA